MSYFLQDIDFGESSASPITSWKRAEARLKDLLVELCQEIVLDRDEAIKLLWAVETEREHPHKAEFLRINFPVLKAWQTLRAAIDRSAAQTHLAH